MKPFLKLFGVEEGNDLLPFAIGHFSQPSDLLAVLKQFFRPTKRDPRDKFPVDSNDMEVIVYDSEEPHYLEHGEIANESEEPTIIQASMLEGGALDEGV